MKTSLRFVPIAEAVSKAIDPDTRGIASLFDDEPAAAAPPPSAPTPAPVSVPESSEPVRARVTLSSGKLKTFRVDGVPRIHRAELHPGTLSKENYARRFLGDMPEGGTRDFFAQKWHPKLVADAKSRGLGVHVPAPPTVPHLPGAGTVPHAPNPEFEFDHPRGSGGKFRHKPGAGEDENDGADGGRTRGSDPDRGTLDGEPEAIPPPAVPGAPPRWTPRSGRIESAENGRRADDRLRTRATNEHDSSTLGSGQLDFDSLGDRPADAHPGDSGSTGLQLVEAPTQSMPEALPVSSAAAGPDVIPTANAPVPSGEVSAEPIPEGGPSEFSAPLKVGSDYRITEKDDLGGGDKKEKYRRNIEAIRLLQQLDEEGRLATPEEQAVLVRYSGWGWDSDDIFAEGNNQFFSKGWGRKNEWFDEHVELRELVGEEAFKQIEGSILNAHYTSPEVISAMWQGLKQLGFDGGRILETSMGAGHFFGLMPSDIHAGSHLTGVELDETTARLSKHLYQGANVLHSGYEKSGLPDNYFDAAISNVPFGNYSVLDEDFTKSGRGYLTKQIHNYFFAKALDNVRPGGLIAFVTATGTMDSKNAAVREYLRDKAELLGAVRLPEGAFAKNAGTDVSTDIIFLRKREAGEFPKSNEPAWALQTDYASHSPEGMEQITPLSEYYLHSPHMMLGTPVAGTDRFGKPATVVRKDKETPLAEQLATALGENLPRGVYQSVADKEKRAQEAREDALRAERVAMADKVPIGAFRIGEDGQILRNVAGEGLVPAAKLTKKQAEKIRAAMPLAALAREALSAMANPGASDEAIQEIQGRLTQAYDAFHAAHGNVSDRENLRAFTGDENLIASLSALERWGGDGTPERSAIFHSRVNAPYRSPESAASHKDAMLIALRESGKLDFERMGALMGKQPHEVRNALAQDGHIYHNPGGDWETHDSYLSGEVRKKLKQAKAAAALDPTYNVNVQALEAVQPPDLGPGDIDVQLGASFVSPADVEHFINSHLLKLGSWEHADVTYNAAQAQWMVSARSKTAKTSALATQKWGTGSKHAFAILDHALNMTTPTVWMDHPDGETGPDGKIKRVVAPEATEAARAKLDQMHHEFSRWIFSDPARTERVVKAYNELFNGMRPRSFDGSHLELPGANPDIVFGDHQKNAVWRANQTPNSLIAHTVGAGKTFTCIAAVMEAKRMGTFRKQMVVAQNHLVPGWEKEIRTLYPGAKALIASPDDFTRERRKQFLAKVAADDWDIIVIPESSFGFIPMTPQTIRDHFEQTIAETRATLADVDDSTESGKRTAKELQRTIKNLRVKMESRIARASRSKDDWLHFEELGVDRLVVDEAHRFKNLFTPTKITRLKGMPNSESLKAFDMLMKLRHIQGKNSGGGVVFATGTPIANSVAELYKMQKYLDPQGLSDKGLHHIDSWIKTFARTESSYEVTVAGDIKLTERLSKFSNIPELSQMFRGVADVMMKEDLKLPTPEVEYSTIPVPMSQAQRSFTSQVADRAKAISEGEVDPSVDNMLKLTSDGRKAFLDMRLLDPTHEDDHNSKINTAVRQIKQDWTDSSHYRGTQCVFLDLGTPKASDKADEGEDEEEDDPDTAKLKEADRFCAKILKDKSLARHGHADAIHFWAKAMSNAIFAETKMDETEEDHEAQAWAAKRSEALEQANGHLPAHFKQFQAAPDGATPTMEISALQKATRGIESVLKKIHTGEDEEEASTRTSLYADIKKKLAAQGVPLEEVAFIHDAKTPQQKRELFAAVNAGRVRVLLGSTEKMGTGMNCQRLMYAMHHLDCPWRPDQYEQRNGRIERQGNLHKEWGLPVKVRNYVAQGDGAAYTMDAFMWQLLKVKSEGQAAILKAKPGQRTAEVGELVMTAADAIAAASGNPLFKERADVERKLRRLEMLAAEHQRSQWTVASRLRSLPREIQSRQETLATRQQMQAIAHNHWGDDHSKLQISARGPGGDMHAYDKNEEGGAQLLNAVLREEPPPGTPHIVGHVGPFTAVMLRQVSNSGGDQRSLHLTATPDKFMQPDGDIPVSVNLSENGAGQASSIRRALGRVRDLVDQEQYALEHARNEMANYQKEIQPFDQEQELSSLQARLSEIDSSLRGSGSVKKAFTSWQERRTSVLRWDERKLEPVQKAWGILSGVRGMDRAMRRSGGTYRTTRSVSAKNVHGYEDHHEIHASDSAGTVQSMRHSLRRSGYRVGVSTQRGEGYHALSATDKDGRAHVFHVRQPASPKAASGATSSSASTEPRKPRTLGEAPKRPITAIIKNKLRPGSGGPAATKTNFSNPAQTRSTWEKNNSRAPLGGTVGKPAPSAKPAAPAFQLEDHLDTKHTVHETRESDWNGSKVRAHLIAHKNPSTAVDTLHAKLKVAGHKVGDISYQYHVHGGRQRLMYTFNMHDADGTIHQVNIHSGRDSNKTFVPKGKAPASEPTGPRFSPPRWKQRVGAAA